jgi:hypothetical protein
MPSHDSALREVFANILVRPFAEKEWPTIPVLFQRFALRAGLALFAALLALAMSGVLEFALAIGHGELWALALAGVLVILAVGSQIKNFTLIEALVLVAIFAMAAALALPAIQSAR